MLKSCFQDVYSAVVDLERVRSYRNDLRSRCVVVGCKTNHFKYMYPVFGKHVLYFTITSVRRHASVGRSLVYSSTSL